MGVAEGASANAPGNRLEILSVSVFNRNRSKKEYRAIKRQEYNLEKIKKFKNKRKKKRAGRGNQENHYDTSFHPSTNKYKRK